MFSPVLSWQGGEEWPLTGPLAPASCLGSWLSHSLGVLSYLCSEITSQCVTQTGSFIHQNSDQPASVVWGLQSKTQKYEHQASLLLLSPLVNMGVTRGRHEQCWQRWVITVHSDVTKGWVLLLSVMIAASPSPLDQHSSHSRASTTQSVATTQPASEHRGPASCCWPGLSSYRGRCTKLASSHSGGCGL